MIIPSGVNHAQFWESAKLKGIKIQSRFVGVHLDIKANGSPAWMASYTSAKEGKMLYKRFPFTEQGEIAARNEYLRFLERNGLEQRMKVKRKRKKV